MPDPETAEHDGKPIPPISELINQTTLRGALYLGAGLVALMVPTASKFLLAVVVAVVLIGVGFTDFASSLMSRPRRWHGMALGALFMVAGLGIFIVGDRTLRAITVVIGLLAITRGVTVGWSALRDKRTRPTWKFDVVRGALFVVGGIVVIALPESVAAGLVFAAAGAAIVVGAVTISFGLMHADEVDVDTLEVGGYLKSWLNKRDVGDEMRASVVDSLFFEPPDSTRKQVGFWVLLILSTTIATLGIIAESTAVVIGAMLVAPLMTPIMGVSAGIVNGWMRRVTNAFATIAGGVAVSIGVAWIVAAWTP